MMKDIHPIIVLEEIQPMQLAPAEVPEVEGGEALLEAGQAVYHLLGKFQNLNL